MLVTFIPAMHQSQNSKGTYKLPLRMLFELRTFIMTAVVTTILTTSIAMLQYSGSHWEMVLKHLKKAR